MSLLAKAFVLFVALTGLGVWSGEALAALKYSRASAGWSTASTWSTAGCGGAANTTVPGATDDVTICTGHTITTSVNSSALSLVIQTSGTLTQATNRTLTIGAGGLSVAGTLTSRNTLTVNGTTSVSGTLQITSIAGTKTFVGAVTINPGGTWDCTVNESFNFRNGITHNGATFTSGAGTYTFQTNIQAIGGSSPITFSGAVAVSGAITLTNNNTGGVTIAGNLTGSAVGSTWVNGINSTLNYRGTAAPMGTRVFTASAVPNTVNYNLAGAQTVKVPFGAPATYYHLTLSGSGVKTMPATAMTIAGDFTMSGVAATSATAAAALTVGGNFTINSLNTFTAGAFLHSVGGNWSNSGTFTAGAGTVTFNGAAAQALGGTAATTFNNLTINNASGVTLGSSPTVSGTLTLSAGTFAVGGNTLTLNGPAIAGTPGNLATTASSSLSFGGTAAGVTLPGSVAALNNLTINNSSGVTLGGSPTLSGTLTLGSGSVTTGAYTLTLAASCPGSISRTSGHVIGNLQLAFPTFGGATTCTYHVGDSIGYAPVTVALTGATAGTLTGRVDSGDHPDTIANLSGIDQTKSANRYWILTPGTLATYTSYDATFQFGAAIDATATTGNFIVAKKNLGAWIRPTVGTRTATTTQATGITSAQGFGEFAVGEPLVGVYKGVNQLIDLREVY